MKKSAIRSHLYVDGTNLFIGLVNLFGPQKIPTFSSLLKQIRRVYQVDQVFFYASYTPPDNKKYKNMIVAETKFYRQVKNTPRAIFYKGYRSPTSGKEKGVDVHLALDIVKNAFQNNYSQAVIMTGDSDLIYAVETARLFDKIVNSIFIPTRFSLEIAYRTNMAVVLNYNKIFNLTTKKLPKNLKVIEIKSPVRKRTG